MPNLQEAIAAIKAGDKTTGKQLLTELIKANPQNENAWLWMTNVVTSDAERTKCLERVLQINPNNEAAKKALATIRQRQAGQHPQKVETPPKPIEAPRKPEPIVQAQEINPPQQIKKQTTPPPPRPLKTLEQKAKKKDDSKETIPRPVSQGGLKTLITDMFRVNKIKDELEQTKKERELLKNTFADTEHMDFYELRRAIADLDEKKNKAIQEINQLA